MQLRTFSSLMLIVLYILNIWRDSTRLSEHLIVTKAFTLVTKFARLFLREIRQYFIFSPSWRCFWRLIFVAKFEYMSPNLAIYRQIFPSWRHIWQVVSWQNLIVGFFHFRIFLLKTKKFDISVTNYHKYMGQPFVLKALTSSFHRYPS